MAKSRYTSSSRVGMAKESRFSRARIPREWLEHSDCYEWVSLEADDAGSLDDVVAMGRDGKLPVASVEREEINAAVKKREIRFVATDTACGGPHLQPHGTLINVDLLWNPARLEQRLGRIRRIGQSRRTIDMLNLVYHDTQDERIYSVLSHRMKDRYDIFGGLPGTIEDDWIESAERLGEMMDKYVHLCRQTRDVFEMRYQETIDSDKNRWELCSCVLSRRDVIDRLSSPW